MFSCIFGEKKIRHIKEKEFKKRNSSSYNSNTKIDKLKKKSIVRFSENGKALFIKEYKILNDPNILSICKGLVMLINESKNNMNHKNLVRYESCTLSDGKLTIISEKMPIKFEDISFVDEFQIKNFLKQILEGMQYLHNKNVFNINLKPENIFLDNRAVVKLQDYLGHDFFELIMGNEKEYTNNQIDQKKIDVNKDIEDLLKITQVLIYDKNVQDINQKDYISFIKTLEHLKKYSIINFSLLFQHPFLKTKKIFTEKRSSTSLKTPRYTPIKSKEEENNYSETSEIKSNFNQFDHSYLNTRKKEHDKLLNSFSDLDYYDYPSYINQQKVIIKKNFKKFNDDYHERKNEEKKIIKRIKTSILAERVSRSRQNSSNKISLYSDKFKTHSKKTSDSENIKISINYIKDEENSDELLNEQMIENLKPKKTLKETISPFREDYYGFEEENNKELKIKKINRSIYLDEENDEKKNIKKNNFRELSQIEKTKARQKVLYYNNIVNKLLGDFKKQSYGTNK